MRNGPLRHAVTYQEPTRATTTTGNKREVFATIGVYRAQVMTLTGRETPNNNQLRAECTHRVRMKRTPQPIQTTGRFLFTVGGVTKTLLITAVIDVTNRDREFEIQCNEVVNVT